MKKAFWEFNPVVEFIYFASLLILPLLTMCPYILAEETVLSCLLVWRAGVFKTYKKLVFLLLFFLIIAVVINPIFAANGDTTLFYLFNRSVNLEPILYGISVFCVIFTISSLIIFIAKIATLERFLALLSNKTPNFVLLMSIVLRVMPLMILRFDEINSLNKLMYGNISKVKRLKDTVTTLLSWSLQSAITTSLMMNAKGYKEKEFTSRFELEFKAKDIFLLFLEISLLVIILASFVSNEVGYTVYPKARYPGFGILTVIAIFAYGLFMMLPVWLSLKETVYFKRAKRKGVEC